MRLPSRHLYWVCQSTPVICIGSEAEEAEDWSRNAASSLGDALHAQVSDVVVEQEREAKQPLDEEGGHVKRVQLKEQQKNST